MVLRGVWVVVILFFGRVVGYCWGYGCLALRFGFGCCGWLVLVLIGFAFLLLRVDIRAGVCGVVAFVWLGF